MKISKLDTVWVYWCIVFAVIFHEAFADLREDAQRHNQGVEARKLDQSQLSSMYNFITADKSNSVTKSNGTAARPKVRKTRVRKKNTATAKDVLVLNETPNKTLVYEIPVAKLASPVDSKSGSLSKREIAKHPERMNKMVLMREDKLMKRNGLMVRPSSNFKKSPVSQSASVSDARTLLLAPLLIAGPMMLAEAMTVGGMGLAVPGIIVLPLLLIPLVVISFIIFI